MSILVNDRDSLKRRKIGLVRRLWLLLIRPLKVVNFEYRTLVEHNRLIFLQ